MNIGYGLITALMKIGRTEITPVVSQTGYVGRADRELARQQGGLRAKSSYASYPSDREESITCRETSSGTYEAILKGDSLVQESLGYKGRIIDFWI
ncbi:MAG: hypothetical protein PHN75_20575 [Syntrophales bacterium]|nr:hypothetical protein [Syntrophales bacterium]